MTRCRVCHRTLTNPAHAAAGIGPVCATKSMRTGAGEMVTVDAAKLAQFDRVWFRLQEWDARCQRELRRVRDLGWTEQVVIGERVQRSIWRRLARLQAMRQHLQAAAPQRAA